MEGSRSAALNTAPTDLRIIATNEKVTGPPGAEMLRRSLNRSTEPLQVMDNACGGGVIAAEVYRSVQQISSEIKLKRIVAADNDEKMTTYVRNRGEKSSWQDFEVVKTDQQSLSFQDDSFTHIYNNFGIFFCPDDHKALVETFRVLKAGGIAGFTSWKSIAWWPTVVVPALAAFLSEAPELPHPSAIFPIRGWSDPTAISPKLEKAGFHDIEVSEYPFTPDVEAEEFAEACAVLVKVITGRIWSREDNEKYGGRIESALLQYLKENYPGGKWDGTMVAIISIAKKR